MRNWLVEIVGESYASLALGALGLIAVALILWVVVHLIRRVTPGTFISGGRRQRLAVTDATPVDNNRRLILVRRDNVEHLLLIGGPSDVVVEQNIPVPGTAAEPNMAEPPSIPREAPRPQPVPRPVEPEPSIQVANAAQSATEVRRAPEPARPERSAPAAQSWTAALATPAAAVPEPVIPKAEQPAERPAARPAPVTEKQEPSIVRDKETDALEAEMSRFFEELSNKGK